MLHYQHFIIRLVRVLDVVKCRFQIYLDRMDLCNCHICASAPLMSSTSCAYTAPLLWLRRAIWLTLTPIFCSSAVCARMSLVSMWTIYPSISIFRARSVEHTSELQLR